MHISTLQGVEIFPSQLLFGAEEVEVEVMEVLGGGSDGESDGDGPFFSVGAKRCNNVSHSTKVLK